MKFRKIIKEDINSIKAIVFSKKNIRNFAIFMTFFEKGTVFNLFQKGQKTVFLGHKKQKTEQNKRTVYIPIQDPFPGHQKFLHGKT